MLVGGHIGAVLGHISVGRRAGNWTAAQLPFVDIRASNDLTEKKPCDNLWSTRLIAGVPGENREKQSVTPR